MISIPFRFNTSLFHFYGRSCFLHLRTSTSLRFSKYTSEGVHGYRSSFHSNPQVENGDRYDETLNQKTTGASWLQQWNHPDLQPLPTSKDEGGGAIDRIVNRLRCLALNIDEGDAMKEGEAERKLSHNQFKEQLTLPWETEEHNQSAEEHSSDQKKKKRVRAPWLAELTIEDSELRRLRRLGIILRERISVPKAGLTQSLLENIHDAWRKSELVRLKFHEALARDMKTAHKIVEHRTGGLVIWRSGSVMVVYRGSNFNQLSKARTNKVLDEGNGHFVPITSTDSMLSKQEIIRKPYEWFTEEEKEHNLFLDELGPRFINWWGASMQPVDADLLPETICGYNAPFRLLPVGMRSRLTNAEMTNLCKLSKRLSCHFALGRNRHHQGLAAAILKVWERSLVVKIAIKQGIQNTNNKLMAYELKNLTGGILLLRNKYFIVIYRGKDFLPASVALPLAERQKITEDFQEVEEKLHGCIAGNVCSEKMLEKQALAGSLAEFQEAREQWGRGVTAVERNIMKHKVVISDVARKLKKIESKLVVAQAKKLQVEKLLANIETFLAPINPSDDRETITDEEKSVFCRIGLRMKAYLPLGIRGIFSGVIENMHLHWKHRELVKLLSKQKDLLAVENTARQLEHETGGILVAIESVPKGFVIIYYRGKNYKRPICLRPRNQFTKAEALKHFLTTQRHQALIQHIIKLEEAIKQMKVDLVRI